MSGRPKIAILDSNTLAVIGLKQMLQQVMPIVTIDTFNTFEELVDGEPDSYVHYFVSMDIVLAHRTFFIERQRKTIVLTLSQSDKTQLSGFHSLPISLSEKALLRSLLMLQQHAHGDGRNLPPLPKVLRQNILSDREIEVMALIVQGYINKEIANRLHIALSTVITHRKNIMDKLGMKSVSALTIYTVTHGYVDVNDI